MKLYSWLIKIFSFSKNSEPPLIFSEKARKHIRDRLKNLPDSVFLLRIDRDKKGQGSILAGFDKHIEGQGVETIDGIPVLFLGGSRDVLQGAGVDWDDRGNVLIYPGIDLHTEPTPNPMILQFISNKLFISGTSDLKWGAWERGENVKKPKLVDLLFGYKFIQSLYIKGNCIQVELKKKQSWKNHEESIADIILKYLETLPLPITIKGNQG